MIPYDSTYVYWVAAMCQALFLALRINEWAQQTWLLSFRAFILMYIEKHVYAHNKIQLQLWFMLREGSVGDYDLVWGVREDFSCVPALFPFHNILYFPMTKNSLYA